MYCKSTQLLINMAHSGRILVLTLVVLTSFFFVNENGTSYCIMPKRCWGRWGTNCKNIIHGNMKKTKISLFKAPNDPEQLLV